MGEGSGYGGREGETVGGGSRILWKQFRYQPVQNTQKCHQKPVVALHYWDKYRQKLPLFYKKNWRDIILRCFAGTWRIFHFFRTILIVQCEWMRNLRTERKYGSVAVQQEERETFLLMMMFSEVLWLRSCVRLRFSCPWQNWVSFVMECLYNF